MKPMSQLMNSRLVLTALTACALAACGDPNTSIPSQYQGTFKDQNGVTLVLTDNSAKLTLPDKSLSAAVQPLTYEKLLAGEPSFYENLPNPDAKLMSVFWITPDAASKQEAGG